MTRPAFKQLVQTLMRRGVPSTSARTRWTFGFQRRLFRLCENDTDFPNQGFLPQMSQTADMIDRGYQSSCAHPAIAVRCLCSIASEIGPPQANSNVPSAR